jgi:putative transposase
MAGTFSQIYIQIVFAVKGRENLVANIWKTELHKYIAGIINRKGHKPTIVNRMPDHIHAFAGLKPVMAISDLVRDIKNNSTNFINDHRFVKGRYARQQSYGAFSYSHSHIGKVDDHILNQEKHHQRKPLNNNILIFLKNLKLNITKRICLMGMINKQIKLCHPFGVVSFYQSFYYNHITPLGLSINDPDISTSGISKY